jgi:hypothetical protein
VVSAASSRSKMMAGEGRAHRERKRKRRQGCQRLGRSRAPWEENAHARRQAGQQPAGREAKYTPSSRALCVLDDPPKRSERRESVRFPGQAARSPNSGRRPRGESRGSVAGNRRGAGARKFRSGGRSRSDTSRVLSAGRSQGLVAMKHGRALARRKSEARSDAGHGWREGETVCGCAQTIKSRRAVGLWVSARRFSRRRKALSGFAHLALTGGVT